MNLKRIIFSCFFIGFIVISLCVLQSVQAQYTADGKMVQYYVGPLVIDSPMNTTYTTNCVCLNFTATAHFDPNVADVAITYSLDSNDKVTVPMSFEFVPLWANVGYADGTTTTAPSSLFSYYLLSGYIELIDLSQGPHCLTVFARYDDYARSNIYFDNQTIYFTIDTENSHVMSNADINNSVSDSKLLVNEPSALDAISTDINDSISDSKLPINTVYAATGVFSLIVIVSCALFVKHRSKGKNVNNLNENS
jgi:hypothetical protein